MTTPLNVQLLCFEKYKFEDPNTSIFDLIKNCDNFDYIRKLNYDNVDYSIKIKDSTDRLSTQDLETPMHELKKKYNLDKDIVFELESKFITGLAQQIHYSNEVYEKQKKENAEIRKKIIAAGELIIKNETLLEKKLLSLLPNIDKTKEYLKESVPQKEGGYDIEEFERVVHFVIEKFKLPHEKYDELFLEKTGSHIKSSDKSLHEIYYMRSILTTAIKVVQYASITSKSTGQMEDVLSKWVNETIVIYYEKLVQYLMEDMMSYTYTHASVFFSNKKVIRLFNSIINKTIKYYADLINKDILSIIGNYDKNLTEKVIAKLISNLGNQLIVRRATKVIDLEFFEYEAPTKVRFSKEVYKDIISIYGLSPSFEVFKNSSKDESNMEDVYSACIFETDLRVFERYGIKAEEVKYGTLLYDS